MLKVIQYIMLAALINVNQGGAFDQDIKKFYQNLYSKIVKEFLVGFPVAKKYILQENL